MAESDEEPEEKQRTGAAAGIDPTQRATELSVDYGFGTFENGSRQTIGVYGNVSLADWNLQAYVPFGVYSHAGEPDVWGLGDLFLGINRTAYPERKLSHVYGISTAFNFDLESPLSSGSIRLAPSYGVSYSGLSWVSLVAQLQYHFSLHSAHDRDPIHQLVVRLAANLFFPGDFFASIEARPLVNFTSQSMGVIPVLVIGRVWTGVHPFSLSVSAFVPVDTPTRDQLGTYFRLSATYLF